MKIIETYIIWIKEDGIYAKLHRTTDEWIVETKTDMYIVSSNFVLDKNWLL